MPDLLPKILNSTPIESCDPGAEVRILSGKSDLHYLLWAVKSFCSCSGRRWHIHIHSDGSFEKEERYVLDRHLPGHTFIPASLATRQVEPFLTDKPSLAHFRIKKNRALFKKLIDFNALSQSGRFIAFDTDILFLSRPDRMLRRFDAGTGYFMNDLHNSYSFNPTTLAEAKGIRLAQKINTGIISVPGKDCLDWSLAKRACNYLLSPQDPPLGRGGWVEQTMYAIMFSNSGSFCRLPESYAIPLTARDEGLTAVHCVTPKRAWFEDYVRTALDRGLYEDLF